MQTPIVFGVLVIAVVNTQAEEAIAVREKRSCACAAPLMRFTPCSCSVGPTPFCSCKPILTNPSCSCGVRMQVSHCNNFCIKACQPVCVKSWIPISCPSFCSSHCAQSCMPKQVMTPLKRITVLVPYECPMICEKSCQKMCFVRPRCTAMCQRPCVQKCILAAPMPHAEMVAEPAFSTPMYSCSGCMDSGWFDDGFMMDL